MHINLAVVSGIMTNEPVHRELASGDTMVQFDVSTSVERDGRTTNISVPVSWRNPSATAVGALVAGNEVVVTGRVERRFFRIGGATQTRTELVAERCLPARRAKSVRSLLATAAAVLTT
jgi:single-strand DNA-binding protein